MSSASFKPLPSAPLPPRSRTIPASREATPAVMAQMMAPPPTMPMTMPMPMPPPRPPMPPPPEKAKPKGHGQSDLRRQQLAQELWQSQEQDLMRRVTLLENLIRRSADLPAFDISWDERKKREQSAADQLAERRVHDFQFRQFYDGPFFPEGQVEDKQPGFYVHPGSEHFKHTVEHNMVRHVQNEKWKDENQITMFMAGDHDRLLDNFALLDDDEEEEEELKRRQIEEAKRPGEVRRQQEEEEEYRRQIEEYTGPQYRQGYGRDYNGRSVYYSVPWNWTGRRSDLYGREGYGRDLTHGMPWWAPC